MGQSSGPGSPVFFMCFKCRIRRGADRVHEGKPPKFGGLADVQLTGRERKNRHATGLRSSMTSREYVCVCGHVGWSNHSDLEHHVGVVD